MGLLLLINLFLKMKFNRLLTLAAVTILFFFQEEAHTQSFLSMSNPRLYSRENQSKGNQDGKRILADTYHRYHSKKGHRASKYSHSTRSFSGGRKLKSTYRSYHSMKGRRVSKYSYSRSHKKYTGWQ